MQVDAERADIHQRTETLVGPTDVWLSLRGSWRVGSRLLLGARLGVTLPAGTTVTNPFRLGDAGKRHQHLQFGTGTYDPIAELSAQVDLGRFSPSVWVLGKASLYENEHGYQAGPLLYAGLRLASDLWLPRWRFLVGALVYHEEAERWGGVVQNEGNLGRTDVLVESAIYWTFARAFTLSATVRVPVWSHVVGAQLSPALGELGVTRAFDLR